ncbi:hypothetical protein [Grimontia sp. SpTr1]|uniref:hypothetical protein n=1 Tax=Grimontia sp. SpTr1 TaxID=2995319 RepID=UPI00248D1D85|nr:hypothetical protein [Grimontia sp. SpTr1]
MTSSADKKRVIVLGGKGETGYRIMHFLRSMNTSWEVVGTSRHAANLSSDNTPLLPFDLASPKEAIKTLSTFDLAIIAIGPMEKVREKAHLLCLDAGIDCIDINDSITAADSIFSLDQNAKDQNRLILTGMGFMPGLSSLMLARLAEEERSSQKYYSIRAYMGAAYGGGKASPHAILSSFEPYVSWIKNGKRQKLKTPWKDGKQLFTFSGHTKAISLIPYSAVENTAIVSEQSNISDKIESLDSRYNIQYLHQGFARFLAAIAPSEKRKNQLADMFYKSGQSMKEKRDADPDTILWCYPDDSPEKGLLLHGMISSYDLTALVAACCAELYLNNQFSNTCGVLSVESLSKAHRYALIEGLSVQGVHFKEADLEQLKEAGLYFGWVECPQKYAQRMKHYSRNWYTAPKQHPRMIPLQKMFLLESDIWGALRKEFNPLSFAGFIVKTLSRWRQHQKMLSEYSSSVALPPPDIWAKAVKDISMFTSGYSCARDALGQDKAYKMYRKMFLETGKMEMRWLWPDAQQFTLLESPHHGAVQYWLAYLKSYADLNIITLSSEVDEIGNTFFVIKDCLYANLFSFLGCPELSHLVREMEREAFEYILLSNGGRVEWDVFEQGNVSALICPSSSENIVKHADPEGQEFAALHL